MGGSGAFNSLLGAGRSMGRARRHFRQQSMPSQAFQKSTMASGPSTACGQPFKVLSCANNEDGGAGSKGEQAIFSFKQSAMRHKHRRLSGRPFAFWNGFWRGSGWADFEGALLKVKGQFDLPIKRKFVEAVKEEKVRKL